MRFLLDENVTSSILRFLRSRGHETITLKAIGASGAVNGHVARLAIDGDAILITFDADYLDLKKELQKELRVVYIHMHKIHPVLAKDLLERNFDYCVGRLKTPGKVIITENACEFESTS